MQHIQILFVSLCRITDELFLKWKTASKHKPIKTTNAHLVNQVRMTN
jgi:hypothetical protein